MSFDISRLLVDKVDEVVTNIYVSGELNVGHGWLKEFLIQWDDLWVVSEFYKEKLVLINYELHPILTLT
jgi:hypothetical protein